LRFEIFFSPDLISATSSIGTNTFADQIANAFLLGLD
jgi:hypothetical protein